MEVLSIETPSLGDRSYLVHDGAVALVVDPQRDIDRVLAAAEAAGVRITHVAETHMHNDYVSGGLELARCTGATYLVPGGEGVAFEHRPVGDGDEVAVGSLTVQCVATPGHTRHHVAYVVWEAGRPAALFSGGSLLYGTVGRTDLLGAEATGELTRAQYRSVRQLAIQLADDVAVWPTHGFGSFCSSAKSSGTATGSIGGERRANLALTIPDEETFVACLLAGLSAYPRYYAHMASINRRGPGPFPSHEVAVADAETLRRQIRDGLWVVDLAERRRFAAGHLEGTISMPMDDKVATYVGWLVPWGAPVTVIGDSPEEIAEVQRALARIGVDHLSGAAVGPRAALAARRPLGHYRAADFADLRAATRSATIAGTPPPVVLDVRRDDERAVGSIAGSLHVPLQDLQEREAELPPATLWVHCATGYRASIAASILDKAGHRVVLVDDVWSAGVEQHAQVEAVGGTA